MKKLFFLLAPLLFTIVLKAQKDSLTIPELSIELKHEKAIRGHVFFNYITIVENRNNGINAYETGEFYGNSLGLTWKPVMDIIAYAEWLTAYITLFKNYEIEILNNSNHKLELKIKNIGEEYIAKWAEKYKAEDWVTIEEYLDFMRGFLVATSNFAGFNAKSEVRDGWLFLTISISDEHNKH